MFVRKAPGRSGSTKVQLAERRDGRDVVLEHVGTARTDAELALLETKLADPETYNGSTAALMKLGQQQAELRREKETLEAEWMALYEELEA